MVSQNLKLNTNTRYLYDIINEYSDDIIEEYCSGSIDNWDKEKHLFWQVIPNEMINKFKHSVLVETFKTA